MRIEAKLRELGLTLPEAVQTPPGMRLPFRWVRVRGNRAYLSGQIPVDASGAPAGPFGKVGAEVTPERCNRQPARLGLQDRHQRRARLVSASEGAPLAALCQR